MNGFAFTTLIAALTMGPGDKLILSIASDPVLAEAVELPVQEDGTVGLPHTGPLKVAGLTTDSVISLVSRQYSRLYITPDISVVPMVHIYVLGEVRKPGEVFIAGYEGIMEIVARAGGTTAGGDLGRIALVGTDGAERVSITRALKEGRSASETGISSGEFIYVGKNIASRFQAYTFALSVAATVATLYFILIR